MKQMKISKRERRRRASDYPELTHEYLRSILSYDPDAGLFRWIAPRKHVIVGNVAGNFDKDGYRIVRIDQMNYRAARLAVFYMTGFWPLHQVDHKNLDKADDHWDNLRPATKSQNMRNRRARPESSTGLKNIQIQKGGSFVVKVSVDGKPKKIGTFRKMNDAVIARDAAIKAMFGEFGRTE